MRREGIRGAQIKSTIDQESVVSRNSESGDSSFEFVKNEYGNAIWAEIAATIKNIAFFCLVMKWKEEMLEILCICCKWPCVMDFIEGLESV